jgi:hypothetical protein
LLKGEQERIGKSLKSITGTLDTYQAEYTEIAKNFNSVFELLDDCGKAYRLANDFERRCFNQALFEKIRVYENLAIEIDYAEPFDKLLNPAVFELKREFEKISRGKSNGQPKPAAHCSLLGMLNTWTSFFYSAGSSMGFLVRETVLQPQKGGEEAVQREISSAGAPAGARTGGFRGFQVL